MHGLVLKAVQQFITDLYGATRWGEIVAHAGLDFDDFASMSEYDKTLGLRVLKSTAHILDQRRAEILEDIGTYLVSHPNVEALRRLLRFGGANYNEFLNSLDDLPGRVQLAVPNLVLPSLQLREHSANHFSLTCNSEIDGFGHVLIGMLRAMADDYGALVLVELRASGQGCEILAITLLEDTFSEGRNFDLGAMVS